MSLLHRPSQITHSHPKYTVFISHAGPDKQTIALPLRAMLQTKGVSAFVDEADLKPGDKAPKAMIQAMETAPVGVFILSPEFAARKWPVKELYCFQRREREADSKGLSKPVLIPVFYRLPVEDCGGNFLWRTGQDGKMPFQDEKTRFLERQNNGEAEANFDELKKAMGMIGGVTGVRNDMGASNADSAEMRRRRDELLNNVCKAILEKVKEITAMEPTGDQIIPNDTPDTPRDSYAAVFNVPKNRSHVQIDLRTNVSDGELTYVERIRELVIEQLGERANVVGVYGAGGMGKTTAVKHIGNNREVQERFPDGVLYVKLGQDATVQEARAAVVGMVEASGGKRLGEELRKKKNLKEVIRGATEWFRGKRILLVADDVWEHEEQGEKLGEAFIEELSEIVSAGNESALLFTTRSGRIAQKAVTRNVHMQVREVYGEEARGILIRSAGRGMEDWEDGDIRPVIEELLGLCGGLPVALVVSGKGVGATAMRIVGEKKLAWKVYGGSMEECEKELLEKSGHDDYPALYVNVEASLVTLSRRSTGIDESGGSGGGGGASSSEKSERLNEMWKRRFRSLCVLEKQGWGPVAMVQRLWGMESLDETKNGLSALEEVGLVDEYSRELGGVVVMGMSMHDLLNDAASRMAREGGGVAEEHQQLLNSYDAPSEGERCRGWWSEKVAGDYYIHGNLGRHLVCSGEGKELVELLLRPEWVMRQVEVSGVDKLVEDFERGREVLREWRDEDGEIGAELSIGVEGASEMEKRENVVEALGYVKDAVRLGSGGIGNSGREAYFQVQGRLVEIGRVNGMVREYLERMAGVVERPIVHSVRGFLGAPGGALKGFVSLRSGVRCMARMREEGQFVCGCLDGWIFVVDVVGERVLMEWEAHGGSVFGIALSEDEGVIVSGSADKRVKMWGREDGRLLKTFEGHRDKVYCVAMTRDGKRIISGGDDGAKEWGVESGNALREVEGIVLSLAVTRNEDCVYLGSSAGIQKWRFDESTSDNLSATRRRRVEERSETSAMGWKVWRWSCCGIGRRNDEGESSSDEYIAAPMVYSMTLMSNGGVLVTGNGDGTVRMFDTETMTQIKVLEGYSEAVYSVTASEDGQRVLSGSEDGMIQVWSVENEKEVCAPLRGHWGDACGVCFMHGDEGVVSCSDDGTVRIWDADERCCFEEAPRHDGTVFCVAIMPCGRRVLSGSEDKTVRMWDLVSGYQIGSALRGHSGWVWSVAAFPEGDRAVSGSGDQTIRIWDLKEWKEVEVLEGHEDTVSCIAVTGDGRGVVSGSWDRTVRIWELGVGPRQGRHSTLEGHSSEVEQVFVSVDGKRVISASIPEIIVWDIETLGEIRRLENREAWRWPRHRVMSLVGEDELSRPVYGWVETGGRQVFIRSNNKDEDVVAGTLDTGPYRYDISGDGEYMCVAAGGARVGMLRMER